MKKYIYVHILLGLILINCNSLLADNIQAIKLFDIAGINLTNVTANKENSPKSIKGSVSNNQQKNKTNPKPTAISNTKTVETQPTTNATNSIEIITNKNETPSVVVKTEEPPIQEVSETETNTAVSESTLVEDIASTSFNQEIQTITSTEQEPSTNEIISEENNLNKTIAPPSNADNNIQSASANIEFSEKSFLFLGLIVEFLCIIFLLFILIKNNKTITEVRKELQNLSSNTDKNNQSISKVSTLYSLEYRKYVDEQISECKKEIQASINTSNNFSSEDSNIDIQKELKNYITNETLKEKLEELNEKIQNNINNINENKKRLDDNFKGDAENKLILDTTNESFERRIQELYSKQKQMNSILVKGIYATKLSDIQNTLNNIKNSLKESIQGYPSLAWILELSARSGLNSGIKNEINSFIEEVNNKPDFQSLSIFIKNYNNFNSIYIKVDEFDNKISNGEIIDSTDIETEINNYRQLLTDFSIDKNFSLTSAENQCVDKYRTNIIKISLDKCNKNDSNDIKTLTSLIKIDLIYPAYGEQKNEALHQVLATEELDSNLPENAICKVVKAGYKDLLTNKTLRAQVMVNK